jgi:hypothetical protein
MSHLDARSQLVVKSKPVIPAKAGTHLDFDVPMPGKIKMGPSVRWDDGLEGLVNT